MLVSLLFAVSAHAAEPTFTVGSYGRGNVSTDLEGGRGESFNIARYGPRLEKDPYVEIDLGWGIEAETEGDRFDVLITPALSGDLFHYDGTFDDALALRNLYALGTETIGATRLQLWAGSRMYRGDDVYLLDFWPLDEQNTWGGGAVIAPHSTEIAVHMGVNRLAGDQQVQTLTVTTPGGVAGQEVLILDRQRSVATLRLGQELKLGDAITLRGRLYGELHRLPEGRRAIEDPFSPPSFETLPDDRGSLVGLQLSAWGWADQSFAHVWLRRETGIAAYDELFLPTTGVARDNTLTDAAAWQLAWAANHEFGLAGIMVGGYWRDFHDADGQDFDVDDRTELVLAFRPQVYPTERTAIGVEWSQQEVRPRGPNARTGQLTAPSVSKFSVLPAFQVAKGGYSRPRIHLIYTATWLDEDARAQFDPRDIRVRGDGAQHFVGIGAEWWIRSRGRTFAPEPVAADRPEAPDEPELTED